jgi:hypothetical protein
MDSDRGDSQYKESEAGEGPGQKVPPEAQAYAPDDQSPSTSLGMNTGSEIERSVLAASAIVSRNIDLEQRLQESLDKNTALNELFDQQSAERESRITELETLLVQNRIPVPLRKRKEETQAGSTTITGLPIINVGPEKHESQAYSKPTLTDPKLPLEDPEGYINEFLLRMKVILSKTLAEAKGDYEGFLSLLSKGYAERSRIARDGLYKKMIDLGSAPSSAAEIVIQLVTEDVLYKTIVADMESALNILDVRAKSLAKRKQEIADEQKALSERLENASAMLQRAEELEAGLQSLKEKEGQVSEILSDRKRIEEEAKKLKRHTENLKWLAASLNAFYTKVTGSATENRELLKKAYSGFGARLESIIREYAAKGAAIMPAHAYNQLLKYHVNEPQVIRGVSSIEQKERLCQLMTTGTYKEYPAIQNDDLLGTYFITEIYTENRIAVANFCVFGLHIKESGIEHDRLTQLAATAKSVRESIIQHYAGMHFLSEPGPSGWLADKINAFFEAVKSL